MGVAVVSSRSDPAFWDIETLKRRHHAERAALKEQRRRERQRRKGPEVEQPNE